MQSKLRKRITQSEIIFHTLKPKRTVTTALK